MAKRRKNPAAVTLGRLGGKARAKALNATERKEAAETASAAASAWRKAHRARSKEIARKAAFARHRKPKR